MIKIETVSRWGGTRPGAGGQFKRHDPIALGPAGPSWYVYQTYAQREGQAARELARAGYCGYAPLIAVRKPDATRALLSRFPGYGFFLLESCEAWRPIADLAGVARVLVGVDGRPARVPTGEIELHRLDDDRLCDLARETLPILDRWAEVTILDGALTGHQGTVVQCDGLSSLVELVLFHRIMTVRLDRAAIEVV